MLVSNFTIGPGREPGDRTTDYCLQITNLEPDDVEFLFECFATPSTMTNSRSPSTRWRKYSVCGERRSRC